MDSDGVSNSKMRLRCLEGSVKWLVGQERNIKPYPA